jgi:hypothetical protein
MNNKIRPFNNEIEVGLRILIILRFKYPASMDKELLNYFSFFSLHSKDIGDNNSLHPDVPNRFGELSVKIELIHRSLNMLILKGLVSQISTKNGIEYVATEAAAPFIDSLSEKYSEELIEKVKWTINYFRDFKHNDIREFVRINKHKWGSEISYCTKGLLDE